MPFNLVFPHDYKTEAPKCVVRIGDNWYDCTHWRHSHPGGAQICDLFHDRDATDAFYSLHSKEAVLKLKRMKAFPLRDGDLPRDQISQNFDAFVATLKTKGLFDRNWGIEILWNILPVLTMIVLGSFLSSRWPLVATLLLALGMQQAGWLGHDYGHGRGKVSALLGLFISGLINALSPSWWSHKHNMHHSFPNRKFVDVDIHNEPILFLWPPKKTEDRAYRRFQHFFYPLAYAFLFVSWRLQSLFFVLGSRNWLERCLIAINYIWLACLPWKVALGSVLLGGFFVAFVVTVNHQPEEMIETDARYNFIVDQFITTRGVICSDPFFEYFFGGMQYQLEHHLFPTLPRYHHPIVRPLVKKFAEENNLKIVNDGIWDVIKVNFYKMREVALAPARAD